MQSEKRYNLPTVVCLRRTKLGGVQVGCDVYIARNQTQGGWNLPASEWASEYPVKVYGLEESLRLYEIDIRQKLATNPNYYQYLVNMVSAGRPIVLGCWCKKKGTEGCHGDVIVRLAREVIHHLQSQSH